MKKGIFIVAAVTISGALTAQDSAKAKQLDEVVITATKFPQKQSSTGKVVTVIGKEQIEKASGRTLGQLLNEQAGITINGALNNTGSNQSLFMRGASAGRTLVLMDGIPMYDPSLISNEFDLNLLSLNDIERIEVCRGAQSTLYGSDAVAGVINIITVKKDVNKAFNTKATLSAGSFGTFRGNLQVYGKAGNLTYSTRYAKLSTHGFSAAYDSTGNKNFDKDGYNGDVANAALQYQITPALSARAFVQYSGYKSDIDAGIFADEKDFILKNKNFITGAGFKYQQKGVSLVGNYQYSNIKRNYRNDSADAPGFTKFSTDDYFGKTQFVEIYASIALGGGFSFLQGADYRYSSMNNQFLSISSFGPFTTAFKDTAHSQGSMYGSLLYQSKNEKFNAEIGGRLNVHSRYGSNYTYTINPSYNFSSHFRAFASIATSFKAPSLYQLYSSYGAANLKPERATNYELGVQQTHEKISNRLVYFYRKIKDGIDFNNISFKYYNFIAHSVKGIEWESSFHPVKQITATVNYTYIKPVEESQSRVNYKDTSYSYVLRRPQHNLNLSVAWQPTDAYYMSISAKYVSSRYDAGGYKLPDVKLDSYFLLGAYAEYKFGQHLKVFADAQNLTNKKFFDVRGYNSIPFMFNGGITVQL